ncbi:hypothetical protein MET9862_02410 [Methylobacterium symbioticum]|uniref:Uncharacterized protein n=1 Tax=Methylobacterium symbioticum TaxID=2584084 RepID=A0A509ECB5_9HYPH|nr:hypothetical protein MET9862_02410 [Methylobacterium symbioticum]
MSLLAALTIVGPFTLAGLAFFAGQARYGWGR